jgi:hypothetical protein
MFRSIFFVIGLALPVPLPAAEPEAAEKALTSTALHAADQGQVAERNVKQCTIERGLAVQAFSECSRQGIDRDCSLFKERYDRLAKQCEGLIADLGRAVDAMQPLRAAPAGDMASKPKALADKMREGQGSTKAPDTGAVSLREEPARKAAPVSALAPALTPTAPSRARKRYRDAKGNACVAVVGSLAERMRDRSGTPFVKYNYTISNSCASSFTLNIPFDRDAYGKVAIGPRGKIDWFCTEGYPGNTDCKGGIAGKIRVD